MAQNSNQEEDFKLVKTIKMYLDWTWQQQQQQQPQWTQVDEKIVLSIVKDE